MTYNEAVTILEDVRFGLLTDSYFHVSSGVLDRDADTLAPGAYLQLVFTDVDTMTVQKGRKWALSQWMTKSELVQTALMACLAAVEHEARETFTYKGTAVYAPHFDVDSLRDCIEQDVVTTDYRPDGAWVGR